MKLEHSMKSKFTFSSKFIEIPRLPEGTQATGLVGSRLVGCGAGGLVGWKPFRSLVGLKICFYEAYLRPSKRLPKRSYFSMFWVTFWGSKGTPGCSSGPGPAVPGAYLGLFLGSSGGPFSTPQKLPKCLKIA